MVAEKPSPDLMKEWNARLRLSGLTDIEFYDSQGNVRDGILKASIGSLRKEYRPDSEFYFRKASWYLHHTPSLKGMARKVWALHAEGLTVPEIGRELEITKNEVRKHVEKTRDRVFSDFRYEQGEADDIVATARSMGFKIDE